MRPVLAGHRRALAAFTAWCVLGALPVLASGQLVAAALDRGFLAGNAVAGLALLGCYGVTVLCGNFGTRQAIVPMSAVVEALRDHLVDSVVRGSLHSSVTGRADPDPGTVARVTRQSEQARQTCAGLLMALRSVGFALLAALVGLFTLAPAAGLLAAPPVLLGGALLVRLSREWRRRYERSLAAEETLSAGLGAMIPAIRDVLACGATARAVDEARRDIDAHARAAQDAARIGAARLAVVVLTARAPLIALLLAAPWLTSSGALSAGEVVGAVTYLVTGLDPALRSLAETVANMGLQLSTVLRRLAAVAWGERPAAPGGPQEQGADGGELVLRQVTFRYGPHSEPVLDGVDLTIPHGEHLAVVGPSGAGKSTLASVLAGLLPPGSGTVSLGTVPLERVRPGDLPSAVLLLPQQAYVFTGTVRDNLTYCRPEATDREVRAAVRALGAEDLVAGLGGLDAAVERPGELPESLRQSLVLVRGLLSPARIVILDEATCHLDAAAEARAEHAFASRGGTLIVIAHRISSALRARNVLVLDGGGARTGTHEELCRSSGTYAELVRHWAGVAG